MGTISYDFESDTPGSEPSGWSKQYEGIVGGTLNVADDSGDNVWQIQPNGVTHLICHNDDVPTDLDDYDISGELTRVDSGTQVRIYLRNNNGDNSSMSGFRCSVTSTGIFLDSITNRSSTDLIDSASKAHPVGTKFGFRFECTGTTVRARTWLASGSEPGTWDVSGTSSDFASGHTSVGGAYDVTFDDIVIEGDGIGTDVDVVQDPVGTLSVTGYDPIVGAGGTVPQIPSGAVRVAGKSDEYGPFVYVGTQVNQSPVGTLVVAGYDPTVEAPEEFTPGTGTLEIAGFDPIVSATSSTLVDLFFKFKDAGGAVRTRQLWRRPLVTEVSTTYQMQNIEEHVMGDGTGGAFTVSLPSAVGREGYVYSLSKTDASANVVKLAGIGGQTINGDADFDLEFQDETVTVISNNANWRVI